jgi:hypothetical protein
MTDMVVGARDAMLGRREVHRQGDAKVYKRKESLACCWADYASISAQIHCSHAPDLANAKVWIGEERMRKQLRERGSRYWFVNVNLAESVPWTGIGSMVVN